MKVLRAFGSIINTFISIIMICILVGGTMTYSVFGLFSADSIRSITKTAMADETVQKAITDAIISSDELSFLPEEQVKQIGEILSEPVVQDTIADILTDVVSGTTEPDKIEVADKLAVMLESEPQKFNEIFESQMTAAEISYDDLYDEVKAYADKNKLEAPKYGTSVSEIYAYMLKQNSAEIDGYIKDAINNMMNESNKISQAGTVDSNDIILLNTTTENSTNNYDIVEQYFGDYKKSIATMTSAIEFFNSATFIIIVAVLAVVVFLIMSLLTWSFRIPMIFYGVTFTFSGIITLLVSFVPTVAIISAAAEVEMSAVLTIFEVAWGAMSGRILICGIAFIAIAVIMFVLYGVTGTIINKRKQNEYSY